MNKRPIVLKNPKVILLICLVIGLYSCGSALRSNKFTGKVNNIYRSGDDLSKVSEMGYFAPVYHFPGQQEIDTYTPQFYIKDTNWDLDSILAKDQRYAGLSKIVNEEGGFPLVEELAELFDHFKQGDTINKFPSLVKAEMKRAGERFGVAFYIEPEIVDWNEAKSRRYFRPDDNLFVNNSKVHVLLLDSKRSKILFYGNTKGDPYLRYSYHIKWSLERLFDAMLSPGFPY